MKKALLLVAVALAFTLAAAAQETGTQTTQTTTTPKTQTKSKKVNKAWLHDHRKQITIFWLPPYCPSLNLIERLWGHLKRTILANVLFRTMDDLVMAFRRGIARFNGHRDKMGFMFDHDDIQSHAA